MFTRNNPHIITQIELNDLIRDLNLSKEKAEILGFRLQEWNLLAKKISVYRNREHVFSEFYSFSGDFTYCNDINGLMETIEIKHIAADWRLNIV